MDKVSLLNGYSHGWKDKPGVTIGLIAQEVEEVYPELVTESKDGYKKIDYPKMIPILLEAIKELKARVEELER